MKSFKAIQVVALGIIMITCSGCNLFNGGGSDSTSQGTQMSGSVFVPAQEESTPFVIIPEETASTATTATNEGGNTNPVPEPMTLLLLGPALFGLYAMKKKKT